LTLPGGGSRGLAAALAGAVLLAGCSTAPRAFTPTLAAAPSGPGLEQFDADLADCNAQVASGRRSGFAGGRGSSVAAGTAVGLGAGLATGASAAAGGGMMAGAAGAAGLAAGFLVAAPIAMVAVSRSVRVRKEREIQAATTLCLEERGYVVTDWERTKAKVPA
jgi:hypothetical protein